MISFESLKFNDLIVFDETNHVSSKKILIKLADDGYSTLGDYSVMDLHQDVFKLVYPRVKKYYLQLYKKLKLVHLFTISPTIIAGQHYNYIDAKDIKLKFKELEIQW